MQFKRFKLAIPIILIVITSLFATGSAIALWHKEETIENQKTNTFILWIAIASSIVGAITGIYQTYEQNKAETKADNFQKDLLKANEKIIGYQQNVIDTSQQIIILQRHLNQKSDSLVYAYKKLSDSEIETRNQLTGGQQIPRLHVTVWPKAFHDTITFTKVDFGLTNNGNYPLHQVKVEITDVAGADFRQMGIQFKRTKYGYQVNGQATPENTTNFIYEIGTITGLHEYPFHISGVSDRFSKFIFYSVNVQWSNGNLYYLLHFTIKNGKPVLVDSGVLLNGVEESKKKHLLVQFLD